MTRTKLSIERLDDETLGVDLSGDPQTEPAEFRVAFPGGDVSVVRTSDGEFWVHANCARGEPGALAARRPGRFCRARLDVEGAHAAEMDLGDWENPGLYHVALLVGRCSPLLATLARYGLEECDLLPAEREAVSRVVAATEDPGT